MLMSIYLIGFVLSLSVSFAAMIKGNKPEFMRWSFGLAIIWPIWLPFIILVTLLTNRGK